MNKITRFEAFKYSLVLLIVSVVSGCGGGSNEVSRADAKNLISSSDQVLSFRHMFEADSVKNCLKEAGVLIGTGFINLTDDAKADGLVFTKENHLWFVTFESSPGTKPAIEVTGVRNYPNQKTALAKFEFHYGIEFVDRALGCFAPQGHKAIFAVYDDGWRVEQVSLVRSD